MNEPALYGDPRDFGSIRLVCTQGDVDSEMGYEVINGRLWLSCPPAGERVTNDR